MALTFLNSSMIEVPVSITTLNTDQLTATDLKVDTVNNASNIYTTNLHVTDIILPEGGGNIINNTEVFGDMTVYGNFTALSGVTTVESTVVTTTALSVVNTGLAPALYVKQSPSIGSIATFVGVTQGNDIEVLKINNADPDQDQTGVSIIFPGQGHTLTVGPTAYPESFIVKSNGNVVITNTLSANNATIVGTIQTSTLSTTKIQINDGRSNVVVGESALRINDTGNNNTAVGYQSLYSNTSGSNNTAIGREALQYNTTGGNNIGIGRQALQDNTTGSSNIALGVQALKANTSGINNTATGFLALYNNTTGNNNTATGVFALYYNTDGKRNTATGYQALYSNDTSTDNVAVGYQALHANTVGNGNVSAGFRSLSSNTSGDYNVAVGYQALNGNTSGNYNTAVGAYALSGNYTNCTALGYNAQVTENNQVQLGNPATTTYAYGAVNDRSDERDKTDIRDTVLGLNFIEQLRPVDFKWDYRDSYYEEVTDSDGNVTLQPILNDGSKKRFRYHHGVIAQEVKQIIDTTGIDFGGYQDHKVNGGKDVLTIGYSEFIAPLIKAVQELSTLNAQLCARVIALENS